MSLRANEKPWITNEKLIYVEIFYTIIIDLYPSHKMSKKLDCNIPRQIKHVIYYIEWLKEGKYDFLLPIFSLGKKLYSLHKVSKFEFGLFMKILKEDIDTTWLLLRKVAGKQMWVSGLGSLDSIKRIVSALKSNNTSSF